MANGLLIVEGISDRDFVEAFLEYENLNIELDVRVVTAPDIDTAVHNEPVNTPKTHKNKKN